MTVYFISFGCDKNLVDSEQMMGLLNEAGYEFTDDENEADVIVINTCCFIGDSKKESIDAVIEAGTLKKEGKLKYLIAAGCLAERYPEEIRKSLPEVDAIIGTTAFDEIVSVIEELESKGSEGDVALRKKDRDVSVNPGVRRVISTGGHYEYLKIAEGCDKHCTYCIIPEIRGRYRSFPMERLVSDAEELASSGVKELILVAQETTVYGRDLYGKKMLPELLRELSKIEGLKWIRLMYCYPEEIDHELIAAIKELPKVCHYLDMPVQHCSDSILKRMGRRTTKADITALIKTLRAEIPDITLRTTLISGFPGESEEDHKELLSFVEEMSFDRLGVFTYSREEGTKAADFPDQCPEELKVRRRDEIMALQQEISSGKNELLSGRELYCMIEGRIPEDHVLVARTMRDAPDIDGLCFIDETAGTEGLLTGDFVKVKIKGSSEYDLFAELC